MVSSLTSIEKQLYQVTDSFAKNPDTFEDSTLDIIQKLVIELFVCPGYYIKFWGYLIHTTLNEKMSLLIQRLWSSSNNWKINTYINKHDNKCTDHNKCYAGKNDMEYSNDGDLRLIDCLGSTYSEQVDINIDLQDKKEPMMLNMEEKDSKYGKHKSKCLMEKIV